MLIKKQISVLAAALLLSGCVSVSVSRLEGGPARPILKPEQVTIYREASQVRIPYVEVALLHGAGHYNATNEGQMFEKMRKRAAALGANGVILGGVEEPTTGVKVANALLGTPANRKSTAVAIYVDKLGLE